MFVMNTKPYSNLVLQTAVVEKTAILTFEQHLADACNKETIGESNRDTIQWIFVEISQYCKCNSKA